LLALLTFELPPDESCCLFRRHLSPPTVGQMNPNLVRMDDLSTSCRITSRKKSQKKGEKRTLNVSVAANGPSFFVFAYSSVRGV
jgi:hypothetical protein